MRLVSLSQKCFESNTKCGKCDKKDTAACLHPHPALRATFPRLGEGFCSGEDSAKNKSVYKRIC